MWLLPITVTARSKAWTVFARSKAGIVSSNPNQDMDACVRLFCVRIVLCVGSGFATGWSPVQGVLEKRGRAQQRAVVQLMNEWKWKVWLLKDSD
jgi:hypothetical protein